MVTYGRERTELMSAEPLDEATQLHYCEVLLQLGRAAEALARLSLLAARDPQNADVHGLLAQALLAVDQPEPAAEAARRAAALAPHAAWPHRLASLSYDRLGKQRLALAEGRHAVQLGPHEWAAFACLATAAKRRRSTRREAQAAAAEALRLAPTEPEAHRVAGMVAMAAGRRTEASAHFARALSIDPQNASTLNEVGRLKLAGRLPKSGTQLAGAANSFAQAVQTDPAAMTSRHNLDVVIRSFLAKLSYFLFLTTYALGVTLGRYSTETARVLPVVLLAIPAFIATRFFRHATLLVRRVVIEECTRAPLRLPVGLGVGSATAILASACAPQSIRGDFVVVAGVLAMACRFSLLLRLQQSSQTAMTGRAQPMMSAGALWCIAVALVLSALLLLMAATSGGGRGAQVGLAAAVPAIGAALVFRALARRRRNRLR